jgi:hypothetical protein
MSFLTSFWPFPQKEQERLGWSSRLAGGTDLSYHPTARLATNVGQPAYFSLSLPCGLCAMTSSTMP